MADRHACCRHKHDHRRSTDNAGNVVTGTRTITVDQTDPAVTVTAPAPLTNSTASQNVTFTATDNVGVATTQCSVDGASFTACTSPKAAGALAEGSHTVSVRVTDTAGNITTQTITIVVDTTAPVTTIDTSPASPTNSASADFTFSSNEPGGTFQCKLDAGAYAACTSPFNIPGLADGSHTLLVRAIDAAGNVDATPDSKTWTVDTVAPSAPAITSPTDGSSTNDNTPTFTGTAEPNSTVRVFNGATQVGTAVVDGSGNWTFTPSSALPDGTSTITARAVDAAGNVSGPSTGISITLDSTPPATTIGAKPPADSNSSAAHFTFSADDVAATFECKVDAGAWGTCASPQDLSGLTEGSHTFSVRGTDAAGNTESPAKSYTWNVDLTAPAVPVITSPTAGQPVSDTTPTVSGTGEPGATITIYVDGSPVGTVTVDGGGHWTYDVSPALTTGDHTLSVKATDAAGNESAHATDRTFSITAPVSPTTPTNPTTPTPIPAATDPQCDSAPEPDSIAAKMQVTGVSVSRKTLVKFKVVTDQFILARITVKNGNKKLGTSIRAVNKGSRQIVVTIKKLPKKNASLSVRLSSVTMTGGHGVATTGLNIDAKGKLSLGALAGGGETVAGASASCGPDSGGAKAKVKILQTVALGGKSQMTVSAQSNQFAVCTFMLVQNGKTYARTVYVLQPGKKLKKPLKLLGGNKLVKKGKYAMTITSFSADGAQTIVKKTITVK